MYYPYPYYPPPKSNRGKNVLIAILVLLLGLAALYIYGTSGTDGAPPPVVTLSVPMFPQSEPVFTVNGKPVQLEEPAPNVNVVAPAIMIPIPNFTPQPYPGPAQSGSDLIQPVDQNTASGVNTGSRPPRP